VQELNNLEEVHSLRATSSSRSGKTRRLQWENWATGALHK